MAKGEDLFYIKIHSIRATDLILKKEGSNSTIDPYVKIYFDGFAKQKTETVKNSTNPSWKYEHKTTLNMKSAELAQRKLDLEIYDSCILGDNLIGGASVDFYTLLTGPVQHRMVIRNKGAPNGHIEFSVDFEQFCETLVTFKNIKCTFYQQASAGESYLYYYREGRKQHKTYKSKKTGNHQWEDIDQLSINAGLKEIIETPIVFNIVNHRTYNPETDSHEGTANIIFSNLIMDIDQVHDNNIISFVEPIVSRSMVIGVCEGQVYFNNISYNAQMKEGVHTDVGVQGGVAYLPHSNPPHRPTPTCQHPTSTPQAPQPIVNNTINTPVASSASNPSLSALTSAKGLPGGWEMRVDPNGRTYYVDHVSKTTHWSLPDAKSMPTSAIPIQPTPSAVAVNNSLPTPSPVPVPIQQQQPPQPVPVPVQQQQQQQPPRPVQTPQPPVQYPGAVQYPGVQYPGVQYPGAVQYQQPVVYPQQQYTYPQYYTQPTYTTYTTYGSHCHKHHHC